MAVSYNKLWIMLKEKNLKKGELAKHAHISSYAMTSLNHNRPVPMGIMIRICSLLDCDIGDIMSVTDK